MVTEDTDHPFKIPSNKSRPLYRVIQEESAILWEIIVCIILSKKVHMNMGPILNEWSISSFYHISVTVQNRTHVYMIFFLRITHTFTSQSIADSSWITLYNGRDFLLGILNG